MADPARPNNKGKMMRFTLIAHLFSGGKLSFLSGIDRNDATAELFGVRIGEAACFD